MTQTLHLENSAWAAWLAGEEEPAAREHLAACDACAQEAAALRGHLAAFRETIHSASEAREFAWARSAEDRPAASWGSILLHWVPRAALAACLLAAVILMNAPRPAPPAVSSDAADNALLEAIQNDLNQQAPTALAPAESLLAQMTSNSHSQGQGGNQ
jgi:hypothetical protein